jgi:hypothetical protein
VSFRKTEIDGEVWLLDDPHKDVNVRGRRKKKVMMMMIKYFQPPTSPFKDSIVPLHFGLCRPIISMAKVLIEYSFSS